MQTCQNLYGCTFLCFVYYQLKLKSVKLVVGRNAQQCSFCYLILWASWEEQLKFINHVFIVDKLAVNRYVIFLKRIWGPCQYKYVVLAVQEFPVP